VTVEGPDEPGPFLGAIVVGQGSPPRQYRIERLLGRGSQALTFVASVLPPGPGGWVALKVWLPSFVGASPESARKSVQKEWVALARLGARPAPCPHVIRLLDAGDLARPGAPSLPWLALEPIDGGPLGNSLRERVPEVIQRTGHAWGPRRARRLLAGVTAGLEALHEVGVVHRDLKPGNVLLSGDEAHELARVSDLGVSRPMGMASTFGANVSVGSIGYAAPEQTEPSRIGPWTDVFSLAALTYFVLTGEPMFSGSLHTVLARIQRGAFESLASRPRVHPALRDVAGIAQLEETLRRATQANPAERTQTARELGAALDDWLARREAGEHTLALSSTARAASVANVADEVALAPTGPMENRPSNAPIAPPTLKFRVRFGEGADLDLRAIALDRDGHGLGLSARGIVRWDGARWQPVAPPPDLAPESLHAVAPLEPGRFLLAGRQGELAVWTDEGWPVRDRIAGGAVDVVALAGREDGTFVLAARHGGTVALYAQHRGRWFGPTVVPPGWTIADLAPAGPHDALLTGWTAQGKGFLARFFSERGVIEPMAVAAPPLFAAADAAGEALAVGQGGLAVSPSAGIVVAAVEPTGQSLDLTVAIAERSGVVWAAGHGALLHRAPPSPGGTGAVWTAVHEEPSLRSRAMGLASVRGGLVLVTAAGAVLEGRREEG
jgi:serine/threonine protein kinase